ncbi:MAG: TIGR00300 family protein, partial [Nitrososphaerales archaeon]
IPDVITDVVEAQKMHKEYLKSVEMVVMLCTMLHSIAVGNMIPSTVKVVAVDINPSTVTKLLDRGTGQALGVVSDVGAFLPLMVTCLEELESSGT